MNIGAMPYKKAVLNSVKFNWYSQNKLFWRFSPQKSFYFCNPFVAILSAVAWRLVSRSQLSPQVSPNGAFVSANISTENL
ncbi:hypothetical protein NIES2101_09490 [Calothrix sp. HK-06]|nr:hypothetical protein NIES2101_09490 [Calothrix sp. HK-06]